MARIDIDTIEIDRGWEEFKDVMHKLDRQPSVTVGVHSDDAPRKDDSPYNNAEMMALHEFGGEIDHPGGTPYIVINGETIFVGEDYPNPVGYTDPHTIRIPARPALRGAVSSNRAEIVKELGFELRQTVSRRQPVGAELAAAGRVAKDAVLSWFGNTSKLTPNAEETVQRKGFQAPLIENGMLKRAIDYEVHRGKVDTSIDAGSTSADTAWDGLIH